MSRLEDIPETFQILGFQNSGDSGKRRVHYLSPEAIRPSIRFVFECDISGDQFGWMSYDFELRYFPDCRGRVEFDSASHSFGPGHAVLIPPFTRSSVFYTDRGTQPMVAVHFDMAPNFPHPQKRLDDRPPYEIRLQGGLTLPFFIEPAARIIKPEKLDELIKAWKESSTLGNLRSELIFSEMILNALVWQNAGTKPSAHASVRSEAAIRRAVAYIEAHYGEHLTLEALAKIAGLSENHLIRSFHAVMGFSPKGFLNQVRMRSARTLLNDPELTIKEVAFRVGFEDPYHFSKAFRKHDGLSPSQFRQTLFR